MNASPGSVSRPDATRIVGRDVPHDSAVTHVSGRSVFLDDVPRQAGELLVGIVPSPVSHGRLLRLDVSASRAVSGVACVLTSADVPGSNLMGPVVHDEELLASEHVTFVGQPLAVVGADTRDALEAAIKAATVEIEPLPAVLSIDVAIERNSFLGDPRRMTRGDVDRAMADAPHVIEGTLRIGGQEHFYFENQVALVTPGEQGRFDVESSTQHPSEVQSMVADTLGVPFNHVVVTCRRMGGAFGGKETQAAQPAMMAALVARHTRRVSRFMYGKDDDMRFTGKRHPFKTCYRVGFDSVGRLRAVELTLFADGGCSTDLSFAVLERAMLHADSAYYLPAVRIVGRVCRTHLPSNTAFRGFGGPQGVAGTEHVIERIATTLNLDAADVRRANLYGGPGSGRDVTHYGQQVRNNTLPRLWGALRASSDYDVRRRQVVTFNRSSRTHLRGLAMTPVKFGISFTRRTLNQANALVNVYTDGSVAVSTGATEMGQGVYTRIRQVAAEALGVPLARVVIEPTSTDKNHNTSPTAASSGTDLNGNATLVACRQIRDRLAGVAARMLSRPDDGLTAEPRHVVFADGRVWDARHPTGAVDFRQVVCTAYEKRVDLGERGFYATPGVDFNRSTGRGHPFLYFTNGAAAAEVEIDRFTGTTRVVRVDMLMDAGIPLNPGIDRGQIVGGFVQGMGWCTGEELLYGESGELLSHSPTTYKIPAAGDVPDDFRVAFLDNADNDVSLYRSKAVGEPPLLLGLCVWAAIQDAVASVSPAAAASLALPATAERVLMTITADFARSATTRPEGNGHERRSVDPSPTRPEPGRPPRTPTATG